MELARKTDELSEKQVNILYLISGGVDYVSISDILNITIDEVESLTNAMMRSWGVKTYSGLIIEGLKRGYTDVGFEMENAALLHWMQRVCLSERLAIALIEYYDSHKTIYNSIKNKDIIKSRFLELGCGSTQLWNEFRTELLTHSARIRQAARKYGVDLTLHNE